MIIDNIHVSKIEDVHISQIRRGDTVLHNGKLETVCRSSISWCDFMGASLFGDSYRCGTVPVKRVTITRAIPTKTIND